MVQRAIVAERSSSHERFVLDFVNTKARKWRAQQRSTGVSTVASLQGQRQRVRTMTNDDRLIKAAEDMVSFLPQLAKRDTVSQMQMEDKLFGWLIARKLSKIPEGEAKEDLKLNIQMMIRQEISMYNSNKQPLPAC